MRAISACAVAGRVQLIRDVGIGAHQGDRRLVERGALRLALLQVGRDLGVAAEIMDVLQLALRRLHRLAEQRERFERVVEPLAALSQSILQQHFGIGAARAVIQLGACRPRSRSRPS